MTCPNCASPTIQVSPDYFVDGVRIVMVGGEPTVEANTDATNPHELAYCLSCTLEAEAGEFDGRLPYRSLDR